MTQGASQVGLIELYQHSEVVEAFIHMLPQSVVVHLYAAPQVVSALSKEGIERCSAIREVLQDKRRADVIDNARGALNQLDCLIVTTLGLDQGLSSALQSLYVPRYLVVHDASFHFSRRPLLSLRLLDLFRNLKYRIAGSWSERFQKNRGWSGFFAPSNEVKQYIVSCGVGYQLVLPVNLGINYACNRSELQRLRKDRSSKADREYLKVGIPGSVDTNIRDYRPIIYTMQHSSRHTRWVLPGVLRSVGASDAIEQMKYAAGQNTTQQVVLRQSNMDYAHALADTEVFVLCLRSTAVYASQVERLGITKVPGAEDDQSRHRKFAFVSAEFNGRSTFRPYQQNYSGGEELLKLIETFRYEDAPQPPRIDLEAVRQDVGTFIGFPK